MGASVAQQPERSRTIAGHLPDSRRVHQPRVTVTRMAAGRQIGVQQWQRQIVLADLGQMVSQRMPIPVPAVTDDPFFSSSSSSNNAC